MSDKNCECSNKCNVVSPCRGCSECGWADWWDTNVSKCKVYNQKRLDQRQKIIQRVVRVDSAQYAMNRAAMNVYQKKPRTAFGLRFGELYNYPSTMSDRKEPHRVKASQGIYRHTSSSRGSKTSGRPGGASAPGLGVDVKHGSYDRYLARKKGGVLQAGTGAYSNFHKRTPTYEEIQRDPSLTKGGKNVKFSIVSGGAECECSSNCVAFTSDQNIASSILQNFNTAVCDDTWEDVTDDYIGDHHDLIIQNNNPRYGQMLIVNDKRYGIRVYFFKHSDDRGPFLQDVYETDSLRRTNNYQYVWRDRILGEFAIALNRSQNIIESTDLLKALMYGGRLHASTWLDQHH